MSAGVFGPYRLVELLGRGGMGEVWRALDTRKRDRPVALKLLPGHLSARPDVEARFLREARVAATLHEPHVLPIHDYGTVDGRFFIEMRLVEGRDTDAVLAERGPLSAERAVDLVGQVASALDAAHDAGLVHRDVKPSNILLVAAPATGRDFAYLIDFGIAVDLAGTKITDGELRGTWAYTAPERFDGRTDRRADVYALGCVLHEALTGRPAFAEESQYAYMRAHCDKEAPRPSTVRLGVSRLFDEVVAKAVAKDPDKRYQRAGDLAAAARAALAAADTVDLDFLLAGWGEDPAVRAVLQRIVDHGRPERVLDVLLGVGASLRDQPGRTVLRRLVESGHPEASCRAIRILANQPSRHRRRHGGLPRGIGAASEILLGRRRKMALLQRLAESGHAAFAAPAAFDLAELLDESGLLKEARTWWRRAADLVGPAAALPAHFRNVLYADSVVVLRRYAEVGDHKAASWAAPRVAHHLEQQGNVAAAEDVLRSALDNGRAEKTTDLNIENVMSALANLLRERHPVLRPEHLVSPSLAARSPAHLVVATIVAGLANRKLGRHDDARRLYVQVAESAPRLAPRVLLESSVGLDDDPTFAEQVRTQVFQAAISARDWELARDAARSLALTPLDAAEQRVVYPSPPLYAEQWEVYRRLAAPLPDAAARRVRLGGREALRPSAVVEDDGVEDDCRGLLDSADPELAGYAALFLARLYAIRKDRTGQRRALETAAQVGTPKQAVEATASVIGLLLEPDA